MHRTNISKIITLLIALLIIPTLYTLLGTALETRTTETISSQKTLQETINQAQPGSTIQIPSGTYTEVLTINKPLHLKGEGPTTKISPTSSQNGYSISITAVDVTLSNLDITNDGTGLYTTGIKISAAHTTIQDCTFHDTPIGIALWSSQNTISHCEFLRCDDEGIVLLGTSESPCSDNRISSCLFEQNCDGIELQYAAFNTIKECRFLQNTHAGIDAIASKNNNNIITQCEFTGNQGFGLYLAQSSNNQITDCVFTDDSLTLSHATDNTVSESTLSTIHLMADSSLIIQDCKNIDPSAIKTQQSTYEIRTEPREQPSKEKPKDQTIKYPFLMTLLSRFTVLQSLYTRLSKK